MAIGMATGITAGKRILAGAGALVITTKPNSPAETSGITTGDVIISINGKGVKNVIDLKALMLSENNPLRIEVVRRAVKREVTLSSPDKKLGVEVQTYLTASITPNLSIKTKDVGGPSAG
jgi:S1-C subfamily serine protease